MLKHACTLLVLVGACSSKRDATRENFAEVIQHGLSLRRPCFELRGLPHAVALDAKDELAAYDVLREQGLVVASDEDVEDGSVLSWRRPVRRMRVFRATAVGARCFASSTSLFLSKSHFCLNEPAALEEVEQFSQPADRQGFFSSLVHYRYHFRVPDWVHDTRLAHFEEDPKGWRNAKALYDDAVVVLMNDGWMLEREMRSGRLAKAPAAQVPTVSFSSWSCVATAETTKAPATAEQPKPLDAGTQAVHAAPTVAHDAAVQIERVAEALPADATEQGHTVTRASTNAVRDAGIGGGARPLTAPTRSSRSAEHHSASTLKPEASPPSQPSKERSARWITPEGREVLAAPPP